jgi:hypothetical protein
MTMDAKKLREPIIAAFGLTNADRRYTFYYDETNNVRRLRLTPDGFNVQRPECFVLGGIVHRGEPRPIDIAGLCDRLRLQASVRELKLKHLGKGGFLDLLASSRTASFLEWLQESDFWVHYQVTDLLYWSIVDIVDAIIAGSEKSELIQYNWMLKDRLYRLLRDDPVQTAELLGRYGYPNVGEQHRRAFITELIALAEHRGDALNHFAYHMLKGLLEMGINMQSLPYLEDETPSLLIDGFGPFFLNRLCLFTRSSHILDNEFEIEQYLTELQLTEAGQPLRHYRFADSLVEPGVQISDIVTGLLGKLYSHIIKTPVHLIADDLQNLSSLQSRNLALLSKLLDRSTDESAAFAQYVLATEDQQRAGFLLS